jgi:hypothetical protein
MPVVNTDAPQESVSEIGVEGDLVDHVLRLLLRKRDPPVGHGLDQFLRPHFSVPAQKQEINPRASPPWYQM